MLSKDLITDLKTIYNLMQIIALSEGSFTIDQSKKFVPFDTNNDKSSHLYC
jgi:hypothetical protein